MSENLLTSPRLTVTMRESPSYSTMGVGFTDRLFLIGHADGLELNDPYPVASVQEAITVLEADTDSPLLVGLLDAVYAGARDIWLIASAPMSEYELDIDDRDLAYNQQYAARLQTTYNMLEEYGVAQITVPIDAPFNSMVDFLSPLVTYCKNAFEATGIVNLGIMGTRGPISEATVTALLADPRLVSIGAWGQLIGIFVGEVVVNLKDLPMSHTCQASVLVAATMAQLPLDRGVSYSKLPNAISISGPDLSDDLIRSLSEARLNPITRTIVGKRGRPFEVVAVTDNTLALDGSDYWSLAQMRLISNVTDEVKNLSTRDIGPLGLTLYRADLEQYLTSLMVASVIRTYSLDVQRFELDPTKVIVNISLTPMFGVRELLVSVEVGPNER